MRSTRSGGFQARKAGNKCFHEGEEEASMMRSDGYLGMPGDQSRFFSKSAGLNPKA